MHMLGARLGLAAVRTAWTSEPALPVGEGDARQQTLRADCEARRNETWLGDDRTRRGRCGRGFVSLLRPLSGSRKPAYLTLKLGLLVTKLDMSEFVMNFSLFDGEIFKRPLSS